MPPTPGLRRTLTTRDLIVYGLLFIGPLAPVGVFGVLDARTNGAVASVYLFATVAMAFTAWSYAEMSRAVPHAGSVFAYASHRWIMHGPMWVWHASHHREREFATAHRRGSQRPASSCHRGLG